MEGLVKEYGVVDTSAALIVCIEKKLHEQGMPEEDSLIRKEAIELGLLKDDKAVQ